MILFILYAKCQKHYPHPSDSGVYVMEFNGVSNNTQDTIDEFIECYPHYTPIACFQRNEAIMPFDKFDASVKVDFVTPVNKTEYKVTTSQQEPDLEAIPWPTLEDDLGMWN